MTDLQNERFTMAPVALFEYVRDKRITPTAYALWHLLWSYSDSEKRECWPSRATLAEQLGLRRVANVDKYITQLVDAGLVVKFGRSDGSQQLSNGYRMSWGSAENGTGGSAENGTGVVPERAHEQESVNNNHLTRTTISSNRSGSKCVTVESDENGTGSADAGKDGKAVEVPGGKLTDKSVRKDSVKGDPSVTVSEGSDIKGDCRSAKRVIVESPKGDPGIPPNPVVTPNKNPSSIGRRGSADKGMDEEDSFTELLATHPKPEKSSKARHHWRAVIEEGHTPADIIAWARGYAEWAKTSEPRFVKALGGWLEARHWANQPGGVSYRKAVGEDEQRAIVAAAVLKRAGTMGNPSELERLTGLSIGNEDALNVMLRDERDLLTTLIVDGLRAGKQPNSY